MSLVQHLQYGASSLRLSSQSESDYSILVLLIKNGFKPLFLYDLAF